MPNPPRITILPSMGLGDHAKPTTGPKLVFCGGYRFPPTRTFRFVRGSEPEPNCMTSRLFCFAYNAPKYDHRKPTLMVRFDLSLMSSCTNTPPRFSRSSWRFAKGTPVAELNWPPKFPPSP